MQSYALRFMIYKVNQFIKSQILIHASYACSSSTKRRRYEQFKALRVRCRERTSFPACLSELWRRVANLRRVRKLRRCDFTCRKRARRMPTRCKDAPLYIVTYDEMRCIYVVLLFVLLFANHNFDRRTRKVVSATNGIFEITLIREVQQSLIVDVQHEEWRTYANL